MLRVLAMFVIGGCVLSQTTGEVGRFVTDVRFDGPTLVVVRCDLTKTTTTSFDPTSSVQTKSNFDPHDCDRNRADLPAIDVKDGAP